MSCLNHGAHSDRAPAPEADPEPAGGSTAELRDFIEGLPEHLDTVVSERGSSLS